MDKEIIEAQVKEIIGPELDKLVDDLRETGVEVLQEYVGPGRISPEDASVFLNKSYRSIYRWLSAGRLSKLWRPTLTEIDVIFRFCRRVDEVRGEWKNVIAGWRKDQNSDVRRVFYHPRLLAILDSSEDLEKKVDRLTKLTIRLLAQDRRHEDDEE
jgi:hypothetical protein